jgi:hypothetical protein
MKKTEAIKIINGKLGTPDLNNRNTHFANLNSAKDVWWFDIPILKALSSDIDFLHLLVYHPKETKVYHLKVPTTVFQNNRTKFVIRTDKNSYSLELSAKHLNFLKDVRPGCGSVSFLEFVQ